MTQSDSGSRPAAKWTRASRSRLTGPFHRREFDFLDHGEPQHQIDHFFAARTTDSRLSTHGWTELEQRALTTWRWWSTDDLTSEDVQVFPDNLVNLIRQVSELVQTETAKNGEL